ncbi:MAG: hypothetical protein IK032_04855 [Bacteroidales bacterium]|nr:hypothetical protein [Bacteroidales bacterium]
MKKFKKITLKSFMVMAVAAFVLAFASCTDDDNNGGSGSGGFSANDPEGTVIRNMNKEGYGEVSIWISSPCPNYPYLYHPYIIIDVSNNFQFVNGTNDCGITCIGRINGLSSIKVRDTASNSYSYNCAVCLDMDMLLKIVIGTKMFIMDVICAYMWTVG